MDNVQSGNVHRLSCIVLAAGANTRLAGIVPPFCKPLIPINGKPLINHAIEHAKFDWKCDRIIVVASTENVKQLTQVVEPDNSIRWVIQPTPDGVVDAIKRGLELVTSEMVLILCADNLFDIGQMLPSDLDIFIKDKIAAVACRSLPVEEATRFSRVGSGANQYPAITMDMPTRGSALCWIGPLILKTNNCRSSIDTFGDDQTIQLFINRSLDEQGLALMHMSCSDLGVPEEIK